MFSGLVPMLHANYPLRRLVIACESLKRLPLFGQSISFLSMRPRKFVVLTDHSSLQWLLKQDLPKGRLLNWAYKMRQYDFTIEYRRGVNNPCADALSRLGNLVEAHNTSYRAREPYFTKKTVLKVLPTEAKYSENKEDKQAVKQQKQSIQTLVFPQHPQEREALYNDKHFGTILKALRGEVETKDRKELKKMLTNFELIDSILCLRQNGLYRAVVPFQFRRQLLTVYHNDKKAGHKGYDQ